MDPKKCVKLDSCPKVAMVLDKDITSWQHAESIKAVCGKCEEGVDTGSKGGQYGERSA